MVTSIRDHTTPVIITDVPVFGGVNKLRQPKKAIDRVIGSSCGKKLPNAPSSDDLFHVFMILINVRLLKKKENKLTMALKKKKNTHTHTQEKSVIILDL